jgi:copper/silver efflux system protein
MFGDGTGSEVMRRIAAPMVGGMTSATILTLLVIPAAFLIWKRTGLGRIRQALSEEGAAP